MKITKAQISRVSNLVGTHYNDILFGDHSPNRIDGKSGNDTINGKGGDDVLTGGDGYDTFIIDQLSNGRQIYVTSITDFESKRDKLDLTSFGKFCISINIKNISSSSLTISNNNYTHNNEILLLNVKAEQLSGLDFIIPAISSAAMIEASAISGTISGCVMDSILPTVFVTNSLSESNVLTETASTTITSSISLPVTASVTPSYSTNSTPTGSTSPSTYIIRNIFDGGEYVGTEGRDNFIINVNEDITITGGGGGDIFTIQSDQSINMSITITITDFDIVQDKINLSQLPNIHSMSDIAITEGSAIIHLPNQDMRLLHLSPNDLREGNFIFSPSESKHSSDWSSTKIWIPFSLTITLVLGFIWLGFAICRHRKKITPELSDEEDGGLIENFVGHVAKIITETNNFDSVVTVKNLDVVGDRAVIGGQHMNSDD